MRRTLVVLWCSAVAVFLASPVQAQTMYSDIWNDGDELVYSEEEEPPIPFHGIGVTEDTYSQYGLIRVTTNMFDGNGSVLEEDQADGWYYVDVPVYRLIPSFDIVPPKNCEITKHRWYDAEFDRWNMFGITAAEALISRVAVRWRRAGQEWVVDPLTGQGSTQWWYAIDDCVTTCIRSGFFSPTDRGSHVRGHGWAVRTGIMGTVCYVRKHFGNQRGECWGPSF